MNRMIASQYVAGPATLTTDWGLLGLMTLRFPSKGGSLTVIFLSATSVFQLELTVDGGAACPDCPLTMMRRTR